MKKRRILIFASCFFVMAVYFIFIHQSTSSTPYAEFPDPSGKYTLVVYTKNPPLFFSVGFPGQSGDRPAVVYLKSKDGVVHGVAHVEMAQLVTDPVWENYTVSVKLVLDMKLPRE